MLPRTVYIHVCIISLTCNIYPPGLCNLQRFISAGLQQHLINNYKIAINLGMMRHIR